MIIIWRHYTLLNKILEKNLNNNYIYRHAILKCKPLQCVCLRDNMFDVVLIADKVGVVTYTAIFP